MKVLKAKILATTCEHETKVQLTCLVDARELRDLPKALHLTVPEPRFPVEGSPFLLTRRELDELRRILRMTTPSD